VRILITGSRDWDDDWVIIGAALRDTAKTALDVTVIHGGARGADAMAGAVATARGWLTEVYRADWDKYGKQAGHIRNQAMVDLGADVCLAFVMPCRKCPQPPYSPHDSHGTADCMARAREAGIPVRVYRP